MAKREKREWRELTHADKTKYAQGMRRLNLGIWGYPLSTFRAIHLTTREGNDNTTEVFARDLRKLVSGYRRDGYDVHYDGALEYTPEKGLLHWHGVFRIKGGYFPVTRRMLGDKWNEIHGAFRVVIKPVGSVRDLMVYITKHIMKEYVGIEDNIRNKFLFSRGWMREGWKDVEAIAKKWVLGPRTPLWMNKQKWDLVNQIMQAWAEKSKVTFIGKTVNGKRTGYLYVDMGRVREVVGGAFESCDYEYFDFD